MTSTIPSPAENFDSIVISQDRGVIHIQWMLAGEVVSEIFSNCDHNTITDVMRRPPAS